MEALANLLTVSGTSALLLTLGIRLIAYWLRLRAWDRHQARKLAAAAEDRKLLTPPPEPPESLNRHMVFLVFLSGSAIGLGLLLQPPAPAAMMQSTCTAAPSEPAAAEPQPLEQLAQHCVESRDCGAGCRCVSKSCVCAAVERKKGGKDGAKDKAKTPSKVPEEPGQSSGLAALRKERWAGDVAWTGSL